MYNENAILVNRLSPAISKVPAIATDHNPGAERQQRANFWPAGQLKASVVSPPATLVPLARGQAGTL